MDKQRYMREKLAKYLQMVKEINPLYSSRSFAKKLSISPSTYSEFQSGKRTLSGKLLKRLGIMINLTSEELKEFESLPFKKDKFICEYTPEVKTLTEAFEMIDQNASYQFILYHRQQSHYYLLLDEASKAYFQDELNKFILKLWVEIEGMKGAEKSIYKWNNQLSPHFS